MPAVMRDILVAAIAVEPDLEYAGEAEHGEALTDAVSRTGADLVIVGREAATLSRECRDLLLAPADVRTLAIADYDRRGFFFELLPHPATFAAMPAAHLADEIRAAAHRTRALR